MARCHPVVCAGSSIADPFRRSAQNSGNAADSAEPYCTGVSNLLAFAFFPASQNPAHVTPAQLPRKQIIGGNLVISFTQPAGVSGITYGAQWSANLAPGNWLPVADTGSGSLHVFSVPIGGQAKGYLQLMVTDSMLP